MGRRKKNLTNNADGNVDMVFISSSALSDVHDRSMDASSDDLKLNTYNI